MREGERERVFVRLKLATYSAKGYSIALVTHFTLIYTIINAYRQYAICPTLAVDDSESSVDHALRAN